MKNKEGNLMLRGGHTWGDGKREYEAKIKPNYKSEMLYWIRPDFCDPGDDDQAGLRGRVEAQGRQRDQPQARHTSGGRRSPTDSVKKCKIFRFFSDSQDSE